MSGKGKLGFGSRKPVAPPAAAGAAPRRYSDEDLAEFEQKAIEEARVAGKILEVSKTLIDPDPENPRQRFNPDSIAELAASIRSQGQLQPVIVRAVEGGRYQIIAGERRWRAFMADDALDRVQIVVRNDIEPVNVLLMQIHENEQREGMAPMDTARAYARVVNYAGSQKDAAALLKKSEATVSLYLKLAKAPESVQQLADKISDHTTLAIVGRVVSEDAAKGEELIKAIESGTVPEGAVRETAKKALKDVKAKTEKEAPARKLLVADKAAWEGEGAQRVLVIEVGGKPLEIRLAEGLEWGGV